MRMLVSGGEALGPRFLAPEREGKDGFGLWLTHPDAGDHLQSCLQSVVTQSRACLLLRVVQREASLLSWIGLVILLTAKDLQLNIRDVLFVRFSVLLIS